jgi:hypothetical protein
MTDPEMTKPEATKPEAAEIWLKMSPSAKLRRQAFQQFPNAFFSFPIKS